MREGRLILTASAREREISQSPFSKTPTESLWDTVKNDELHVLLREPALMELARRKEPGVDVFCDRLVNCGDPECWFTAIKALTALNTYDAVNRLLSIAGLSNVADRRIILNAVARVLTSAQREQFRRLVRFLANPGLLDVTDWTPTAVRMLSAVCEEKGLKVVPSGLQLTLSLPEEHEEPSTSLADSVHSVPTREDK